MSDITATTPTIEDALAVLRVAGGHDELVTRATGALDKAASELTTDEADALGRVSALATELLKRKEG